MRSRVAKIQVGLASLLLVAGLMAVPAFGGEKKDPGKTLTGTVSDAMCGAKHMMESAADCTRACVAKGSKYALVVGDKVYTLETSDKAALDQLDKMSGQSVKVTGTVDGDVVKVTSVKGS